MLEDQVRDVCARLLDAQVGAGRFDYVQDFSAILPPTVISYLLGVPEQDQERLRHMVDDVFHIEEGSVGMMNDVALNALAAIREYLGGVFAERRKNPRDDMFTDLVQAEITDGRQRATTDEELNDFGLAVFGGDRDRRARPDGRPASRRVPRPAPSSRRTSRSYRTPWRRSSGSSRRRRSTPGGPTAT
jgi:cytochrome P450